jgi:acyl dehydratase
MENLETGKQWQLPLHFTQEQVAAYAALVQDDNPIHFDESYAATTSFKKPVIHGMLGTSVFSKFFGTVWPGEGTLYLQQSIDFKRPMYVNQEYKAVFTLLEHQEGKHQAIVKTEIFNVSDGKICTTGSAVIKHPTLL